MIHCFTIDADWIEGSHTGLIRLYDLLARRKATATVFVTGGFAVAYPELIREAVLRGYQVGTHGWAHGVDETESFKDCGYADQRRWMELSSEAVEKAGGARPVAFRAPNLAVSETTLRVLEDLGYELDSSVPAKRFDLGVGQVSTLRYFRASLRPYHPSRDDLARPGASPIVEVPPSAFFLPVNMTALRTLGMAAVRWTIRRVRARAPLLVSYVHPAEFELPENVVMPAFAPRRYHQGLGPHNLGLVEQLFDYADALGYVSGTVADAARAGTVAVR